MEVRSTPLPGIFWIVPVDTDPNEELILTKQIFIHVIPLNTTYQILLENDIPIHKLLDRMAYVLGNFKSQKEKDEAEYNLYWKLSNVNTFGHDCSTSLLPTGATFLMTDGHPILPTFHSGKLWQCETCPLSFDLFKDLNLHTLKTRLHRISLFGQSINWGVVQQAEDTNTKKPPANDRRNLMEEAIKEPENKLNKFTLDNEDIKWEVKVARKLVVERSRKFQSNQENMDTEFLQAIDDGTPIPQDCSRQMPGTWDGYRIELRKIVTFYQDVKKRPLHYRDFFAFGKDNLVFLSEPEQFFKKRKGATPEILKKLLATHNMLMDLVREAAVSAEGLEAFGKPYKEEAPRMGIVDQGNFLQNLNTIEQQIKSKKLWNKYALRANARRKRTKELTLQLEEQEGKMLDGKLKVAADKFFASQFAIDAENDLMEAATTENKKLGDKAWNNMTEFVITREQIMSAGRREAGNLTVDEWENRLEDEDGTTTINRNFTKLEGTCETFLHLDEVETFLFKAYEIARFNQFPELEEEERRSLQSFFVNAAGKDYWHGTKGNRDHLNAWNEITNRRDIITDFRTNMANWSLSADLVTRANSAFVCAHSVEIMTKVYAKQKTKQAQGIKVLERYRIEELGTHDMKVTSPEEQQKCLELKRQERQKFLELKLPPKLEERQQRLRIDSYNRAFNNAVKVEQIEDMAKHRDEPDKPASNASRASLLEIIAEELESGEPVLPEEGFMADIFFKIETKGKRKAKVTNEKATEVIMSAIDSPRFAEHPSAKMLKDILIMAASSKIANRVDVVEEFVVKKWMGQLENFKRRATKLQSFRTKAAFISLADSAGDVKTYSWNLHIAGKVREMQDIRKRLLNDYQTNKDILERKSQEKKKKKAKEKKEKEDDLCIDSPSPSERKRPQFSQKTPKEKTPDRKRHHSVGKGVSKELFPSPSKQKRKTIEDHVESESESDHVESESETLSPVKTYSPDTSIHMPDTPSPIKAYLLVEEKKTPDMPQMPQIPETPSPILLKEETGAKKEKWNCRQRTKLLSHIIKYMVSPTAPQSSRRGKADLRQNVLTKVSPELDENPGQSRTLDDIVSQWYRYVYSLTY